MSWAKRLFTVEYLWLDRENSQTSTTINLGFDAVGFGDGRNAIAKAQALAPLMQSLSSCKLIGYKVRSAYANETAGYTGEVERRAQFKFTTADSRNYTTRIPGFKDTLLDPNGRDIAIRGASVQTEVQTFIDAIVNGPAGWANGATTISGAQLVAARSARKIHVPSLRRKPRRSG